MDNKNNKDQGTKVIVEHGTIEINNRGNYSHINPPINSASDKSVRPNIPIKNNGGKKNNE